MSYRYERGLTLEKISVGVVIQKMVRADRAGVAFSRNPIRALDRDSLFSSLCDRLKGNPNAMTAQLFSHGRELGAVAAMIKGDPTEDDREAFGVLAKSMSVMAYLERVRTNGVRERQERDLFYAQSLTSSTYRLTFSIDFGVEKNYFFPVFQVRTDEAGNAFSFRIHHDLGLDEFCGGAIHNPNLFPAIKDGDGQ